MTTKKIAEAKKIARGLPVLGLFLLVGCLPPPAPQQIPAIPDYGPPPPSNYQELIKNDFAPTFWTNVINGSKPDDYTFNEPKKGYVEASRILGMKQTFGWVVCGTLTRKERYSGYPRYDGPIEFYALIKNGKVVDHLIGHTTYDHTTQHLLNDDVMKVCARTMP